MSRLKQIGREYKRRYPGAYDEWTDEEVGQAVIDKDLDENDADHNVAMVTWSGAIANIARADTSLRDLMLADSGLVEKIQKTFDYYNPQVGVFSNWWRRLNGESRNKLLNVLTEEQRLLIKQAATLENEIREGKIKQVEFHLFIARNVAEFASLKYQSQLNKEAFGSGMTVEDYSDANKQERLTDFAIKKEKELAIIRQKEQEARSRLELERERFLHELRIKEMRERDRLEREREIEKLRIQAEQDKNKTTAALDNEIKLANEEINLAVKADNLTSQQQVLLIQQMIDKQYDEIHQIEQSSSLSESLKTRKIADREKIIERLTKRRDEAEN